MLYGTPNVRDTETIKRWLEQALQASRAAGRDDRLPLAEHCGVTPQAVDGWRRTGRITKSNLVRAQQFFGHGPRFDDSAASVGQAREHAPAAPRWPFRLVGHAEITALPPRRLRRLDAMLRARLDEWAEDDADGPDAG